MHRKSWLAVALVGGFLLSPGPAVRAADKEVANVAHIKLSGSLDESPIAVDPLFGASSENFRMKLDRIKKAKDAKDIHALYLQLDGLAIGWAKVEELRKAIADFRASGKKTFAFLESGEARDYFIACACDEVCLPESGWLMLTGMRLEAGFYKDLLDKIGVKADLLKMGAYKGAAEPFTRTSMSPEVRQNYESLLDDFFNHDYVGLIVKSRPTKKLTPELVKKMVDEGPYTANHALKLGLVDRIAYPEAFRDAIKTSLDADKLVVKQNYGQAKPEEIDFGNPFAIFKLLAPPKVLKSDKPKVAVIYAVGPIMTGKGGESLFGGNTVGSTTMVEAIRQAENDKTVKAIVLRVDSPGGSALASDLIWAELKRCKKPVVASMGDTAASGGYYICMSANKIYADPGTLTGSIGVFGMKLVIGELENKVGIQTEVISRGANSGINSTTTPFSPSERKAMTALIEDCYDQFLTKALDGRKKAGKTLTREQLDKLAGGRVWTGRQAKEVGLIDELGTLDDAIAAAKEQAGFKEETELLILPKPKSFFDALMDKSGESSLRLDATALRSVLREFPDLCRQLQGVEMFLQQRGPAVWATSPYRIEIK